MLNNELITFLRNLSNDEIKRFENFISSPYFNLSHKINELFKILNGYYPLFTHSDLTSDKLANKLGYSGKHADASIRNLMSRMAHLVKEFLIIEELEKDSFNKHMYALKSFSKKKMPHQFQHTFQLLSESLKTNISDNKYFYNKYLLGVEKYNFSILNNRISKTVALTEEIEVFNYAGHNFINFIISELMSFYLNLEAYKNEFSFPGQDNIYKDILGGINLSKLVEEFKHSELQEYSLILYSKLFKVFADRKKESNYFSYKKALEKFTYLLSPDERTFYYSKLVNYCVVKIVSGQMKYDFNNELFDVNRLIVENKYYLNSKVDHLSYDLFRDTLMHALKLNKTDWALNFIKTFRLELNPRHRTDLVNFAYAHLHYTSQDFDKAFSAINRINDDYFIFKYDLKNLKLKIFYDGEYYENAISSIHSYKQFLRTNTIITKARRDRYRNFVKYFEKLLLYKTGKKRIDLEYIKHTLQQTDNTAFREWLTDKMDAVLIHSPHKKFSLISTEYKVISK
jgi:hypothetical protein